MEYMVQTTDRWNFQESISAQTQQVSQEYNADYWEEECPWKEASGLVARPPSSSTGKMVLLSASMLDASRLSRFLSDSRDRWVKMITDLLSRTLLSRTLLNIQCAGASPPDAVEEKLNRFGTFQPGWRFGEGAALRPDTLSKARQLHQFGKVLSLAADVFPHEDGDVSIMFKSGNQFLEIGCLPGEKFSLTLEEGTDHPFTLVTETEETSLSGAIGELLTFARSESLWDYCDSFIPPTTATVWADSPLIVFATPQNESMEVLCQRINAGLVYSMETACVTALQLNLSVNTLVKGMETPQLSVNPFISGFSPRCQTE